MGKKIGVMLPQEKEGLGQSEAGRTKKNFILELLQRVWKQERVDVIQSDWTLIAKAVGDGQEVRLGKQALAKQALSIFHTKEISFILRAVRRHFSILVSGIHQAIQWDSGEEGIRPGYQGDHVGEVGVIWESLVIA